jgi:hypothetical protein
MSSAYSFAGGSLRLKSDVSSAISNGKVSKKHKRAHKKSASSVEAPSSKMEHVTSGTTNSNVNDPHAPASASNGPIRRDHRTAAEIAYEKSMAKRAEEKILQKAAKSHKEQVEDLNSYLDKLTEYNDIPKVSWTK